LFFTDAFKQRPLKINPQCHTHQHQGCPLPEHTPIGDPSLEHQTYGIINIPKQKQQEKQETKIKRYSTQKNREMNQPPP